MLLPVERLNRKTESTGFTEIPKRSDVEVKRRKTSLEMPRDAIAVRKTQMVKLRRATTISALIVEIAAEIRQMRTRGARFSTMLKT